MTLPACRKSATITIRNDTRTVRIETPVKTDTLESFIDSLKSALTGYFVDGAVIESIYFFEEKT
jgi:hypothetical protein